MNWMSVDLLVAAAASLSLPDPSLLIQDWLLRHDVWLGVKQKCYG